MRPHRTIAVLNLSCILPLFDPSGNDYPDLPSTLPELVIDDRKTPVQYYNNKNTFVLKPSSFEALDIPIITRDTHRIYVPKKISPKGIKPGKIRVLRRYGFMIVV